MNKAKINYWIDVGLTITFLIAFVTGILKWPGLMPSLGIRYTQLPMFKLTRLHDWSGLIMAILVFIHVILHWNWIVAMTKSFFKKKNKNIQ